MDHPTLYDHAPLTRPNTIRVLKLSPASTPSDPLHCTLVQICIETSPIHPYTALSYSWDAQIASQPIQCDGGALLITANCVAAMRALRKTDETVTLWIDSICIDQSNLAEKSMQVALMGQIYSLASSVIVWLGEWDTAMVEAVRCLKSLLPMDMHASYAGRPNPPPAGLSVEEHAANLKREMHENVRNLVKGKECST